MPVDTSHHATGKAQLDRGSPEFRRLAVEIFITFIKSRRVKLITAVQRKRIKKTITTPGKKLPPTLYDEVQGVVFDVIYGGVYDRFLDSPIGRTWLKQRHAVSAGDGGGGAEVPPSTSTLVQSAAS